MAWNANEFTLKLLGPKGDPSGAYVKLLHELMRPSIEAGMHYNHSMATAGHQLELEEARLLLAAELLKRHSSITRRQGTQILQKEFGPNHPDQYIGRLMESAAQAIAMIDPTAGDWHAHDFVMGSYRPSCWQQDETFQSFCSRSVPFTNDEAVIAAAKAALDEKSSLRARKLQKRLGIQFYATDSLAEHLLLEHRHGKTRLYIFHYAEYLKVRLEQTALLDLPVDCAMGDCLEL